MVVLFFLFTFMQAHAASDPVYVDVNPNVYNPKEFKTKKNGVVVREIKKAKPKMPKKDERDAIFKTVSGLDKYLESMDQLDKDTLYIRAKTNSRAELQKLYPSIPSKVLASLQEQINKMRK